MWPANTLGSCSKVHTNTQLDYFIFMVRSSSASFREMSLDLSALTSALQQSDAILFSIQSSVLCPQLSVLYFVMSSTLCPQRSAFCSILMCGMSEIGCLHLFPASMSLSSWPPAIKGQLEVIWGPCISLRFCLESFHLKNQPLGSGKFIAEQTVCENDSSGGVSDLELGALQPHCCHLWWRLVETKAHRLADAADVPRW